MNNPLTLTNTHTPGTDAVKTAQQITRAQSRHSLAGNWDLFAVIGLMACSAAYSICAIMQATGF